MTTATSGLDSSELNTKPGGRRRRLFRRRQITGAALVAAIVATATVTVVGGGVESAEAQFGAVPPPQTDTLCETNRPAFDDYDAFTNNALDWPNAVEVTVGVNSVDGDAKSPGFGIPVAHTGAFTYSVVLDNTGDPFNPDVNSHPSYHPMSSSSPIVVSGTGDGSEVTVDLPPGCRYLMSVRSDGHDLGGSWIRIESNEDIVANDVDMVTNDRLPMAQVVVQAFHDFAQVNAQFDIGETGLADFDVILEDGGERGVDYFGNVLCTNYVLDIDDPAFGGGTPGVLDEGDLDAGGMPTIDATDPGGNCLTGDDGVLTIKYITPGLYGLVLIPPGGSDWVQTTTIEGKHVIDVWLKAGDNGLGGEFVGDIDAATFQAVGFISPTLRPDADTEAAGGYHFPFAPDSGGGDITGCFFNGQLYPSGLGIETVVQNGSENLDGTSEPLFDSYVALNDVGNHDSMMALAETDDNGCFRFVDVPNGTYQLAVWDYELLYIIGFYNVTVSDVTTAGSGADQGFINGQVDMGDLFVLRWFGWSSGHVFYDSGISKSGVAITELKDGSTKAAANGVRDCLGQNSNGFNYDTVDPSLCEPGIPLESVLIRDRDGSIFSGAVTDGNGYYEIPNIWSPMFRFQVLEVGAGALDWTGHSTHDHFDRNAVASQGNCPTDVELRLDDPGTYGLVPEDCQPAVLGGGLLVASIFQQGKRTEVDFGKLSYLDPNAPNGFFNGGTGNGGIAGAVINSVTRAQWAASKSAAEDNEPGVPGATIRLYGLDPACGLADSETGSTGADNPDCYSIELDSLETDSYQHPGAERNGQTCTMPQSDGTPYAAINPIFGPVGDNCTGSWLVGAHTKDGAWDGGFAFADLSAGFYVVELEVPPGYQTVKENDLNTDEGNSFVPALPPSGCVGGYHFAQLDSVYGSPYDAFDGTGSFLADSSPVRTCDRRLVRVQPFRNAGVDMMLMPDGMDRTWQSNYEADTVLNPPVDPYSIADQSWQSIETVPMPGRLFGLVLDDLQMTANQNALTFGEQQGVARIPIGFYDHTGNHVTTVWTDENGHYEVLLPSTFSINRNSPGGVGANMYSLIINDPGPDGNNWGYDPAYITNPQVLDSNPGKMTKADTPVLSVGAGPCSLPSATPQLFEVSDVWGDAGSLPSDYTINGIFLDGADVFLTPSLPDGTLDKDAAILATPYATVSTLAVPFDPGSLYHEMVLDLSALDTAVTLAPGPYQVSFSLGTDLSESPRNAITFHVLGTGYEFDVHEVPAPSTADDKVIQDTIEAAIAGGGLPDLIVVPPLTYRESIVVHEGMVIQGFGPGGIIGIRTELGPIGQIETPYAVFTGTVISPFGALLDDRMFEPWEALVSGLTWDGNQGVEVGPAFQVLLADGDVDGSQAFRIDGFGITSTRANNGAIFVNGRADGLVISNNAVQANNSSEGGAAISLGTVSPVTYDRVAGNFTRVNGHIQPAAFPGTGELKKIDDRSDAGSDGVVIRDNRLLQNGGTTLAGAIGVFNGNDGYSVIDNDICGNYSAEYGGGMSHFGVSENGLIAGNVFQNNESFDEGGALLIGSEIAYDPFAPLGLGTGSVVVDSNQFHYNLSGDDGGAIMVLHALESALRIVNNIIANNVATDVGGAIHLIDASEATIVHNTIANNLSTSSAEDAGGFVCINEVRVAVGGTNTCPRSGGLTTQPHSASFVPVDGSTFSDPALQNNLFWNNRAGVVFEADVDAALLGGNLIQFIAGTPDLGIYNGVVDMGEDAIPMVLNPEHSVLTVPYGASLTNVDGVDPLFVLDSVVATQTFPAPVFGQIANINLVYPGTTALEDADFHLASGASPAADLGTLGIEAADIDRQDRPFIGPIGLNLAPDSGADEVGAGQTNGLMFFSTVRNTDPLLGIKGQDAQSWSATGISTILEGAAGGAFAASIDGLHVLTSTEFLVSLLGNGNVLPAGAAGIGGTFVADDEDIVHYDKATDTWSLFLDGSAVGLSGGPRDIDALHRLADGTFLVSFAGVAELPTQSGTLGFPDEDVVRMVPVSSVGGAIVSAYFEPYFSGSTLGLDQNGNNGDIDAVALINGGTTLLLSTRGANQIGDLDVRDEDVIACGGVTVGLDGLVTCDQGDFVYFDGTTEGLHGSNDVNAVSGPLAG